MSRMFISGYVNTENVLYLLNISSNDTVDRLIFLTLIALHNDNKTSMYIIKYMMHDLIIFTDFWQMEIHLK